MQTIQDKTARFMVSNLSYTFIENSLGCFGSHLRKLNASRKFCRLVWYLQSRGGGGVHGKNEKQRMILKKNRTLFFVR